MTCYSMTASLIELTKALEDPSYSKSRATKLCEYLKEYIQQANLSALASL